MLLLLMEMDEREEIGARVKDLGSSMKNLDKIEKIYKSLRQIEI